MTRSFQRRSADTPPGTASVCGLRRSTHSAGPCDRESATPSTCRQARKDRSSPAARSCGPTARSTSCRRSRCAPQSEPSTTDSGEGRRAPRRERADGLCGYGRPRAARRRAELARARRTFGTRLPLRNRRRRDRRKRACARPRQLTVAGVAALGAVVVEYGRGFAVAPLNRYDAWAIWALKGHALYAFGWADPVVFAGHEYRFANLDYPLWLPSVEAIDFRAMGAFDTRLVHLQFLLFLVAALAGLFALLRDRVPQLVLWPWLIAIALAPVVFDQLLTAYADVPLALVFAVGVASAGRWLVTNERWALALAALCFAGALLTKNEGSLFVFAAFFGLIVVAHRRWHALAV